MVRRLATSTYTPTFLSEVGVGAMLPLFALSVLAMDHSGALAAAAAVVYQAGRLGGSAWGGSLADRLGPVRAAMVSLGALAAGALVSGLSAGVVTFFVGVLIVGLGHGAYHVARQGQVAEIVPFAYSARALTTMAGVWRVANFLGPVIGAGVIGLWNLQAAYLGAAVTAVAAMIALRMSSQWRTQSARPVRSDVSIGQLIRDSWPILRTLGLAVALTGAVRSARLVVIPLWAEHIGMSDDAISLVFAASAAVDMLLFYPAGVVMDRWGRAWTAIPSTLMLGLGALALPFTTDALGVVLASVLLGLGNGWGSGLLMTLGADVAPAQGRSRFIATWMVLQDAGGLAGPAIVSAFGAIALPIGFYVVGGVGVVTTGALWRWIPPWRPKEIADAT